MVKRLGLLMVLAVVVAVAVAATLLLLPEEAKAHREKCPASGIVPDSTFIGSSTNQAGQFAGHVVWFQLCKSLRSGPVTEGGVPQLSSIALMWREGLQRGFFLRNPEAADITLRVVGSAESWRANNKSSGTKCSVGFNGEGVMVRFTADNLSSRIPASIDSPLTMQFEIPVAAGMINPLEQGKYDWAIITYYDHGNHFSNYLEEFMSPMLEFDSADVRLSELAANNAI